MKKEDKKNVVNFPTKNNKKIDDKNEVKNVKRVHLELHRTDVYYIQIDVPVDEDLSKENNRAVQLAWDIVHKKLVDIEKFRIGDGFMTKILKKELVEINKK